MAITQEQGWQVFAGAQVIDVYSTLAAAEATAESRAPQTYDVSIVEVTRYIYTEDE